MSFSVVKSRIPWIKNASTPSPVSDMNAVAIFRATAATIVVRMELTDSSRAAKRPKADSIRRVSSVTVFVLQECGVRVVMIHEAVHDKHLFRDSG